MPWLPILLALAAPALTSPERAKAIERMNAGIEAHEQGDDVKAQQALWEAVKADSTYSRVHYGLGRIFHAQGMLIDAADSFRNGLAQPESDPKVTGRLAHHLGAALSEQAEAPGTRAKEAEKLRRQAIEAFDQAIAADPGRHQSHHMRAVQYDRLNEPDEADASYRKCIELRSNYAPCFVDLGNMYIDYGFSKVGLTVLQTGAKVDSSGAAIWAGLGRAYLSLGRPKDAIESLEKARKIDPDDPEVHFWVGMAYADARMRKEAVGALEVFLKRAGNDVPATRKRAARDTLARMQDVP